MTMILGFLKANKNILLALLFLIVTVVTLNAIYKAIYANAYLAGYLAKTTEYDEAYNKAVIAQQAEYDKQLEKSLGIMRLENEEALKRKDSESLAQIQTQKVIQYVDKIVVKNECSDLASHVVWVLSESTNTISVAEEGTTESDYKF